MHPRTLQRKYESQPQNANVASSPLQTQLDGDAKYCDGLYTLSTLHPHRNNCAGVQRLKRLVRDKTGDVADGPKNAGLGEPRASCPYFRANDTVAPADKDGKEQIANRVKLRPAFVRLSATVVALSWQSTKEGL